MSDAMIDCLLQFAKGPVWDGNLISKSHRDHLYNKGYIQRGFGWQWLTEKGVRTLVELRLINE